MVNIVEYYTKGVTMKTEWLNAEQASGYLGIGITKLYAMAQDGKLPAHKIGKKWKFCKDELNLWIKTKKSFEDFFVSIEYSIEENLRLRDPQKEAHQAAVEYFDKKPNGTALIQLPVGCGKSGLISILPFGIAKGRVLVIAPNLTIKTELVNALNITNKQRCFWHKCKVLNNEDMMAGPYIAILDSKDANIHDCSNSHFVITNIQQLASSADKWLPQFDDGFFDMILVDEGHHSAALSWKNVFDKFPNAKVVNLTATPFRSDQKDIDGELIYKYSFRRAMIKGYIKRLQATYVAPEEVSFTYEGDSMIHTLEEVLKLKEEEWFSRGVALSTVCNEHIVNASIDKLDKLRQSGTHHQIIAVSCSVNHAKAIGSLYRERGYEAAEIHSKMPEDKQEEVVRKLKTGILDCIIQVQMLGEGFDHKPLSVAAIFRPFRSLAPYVQFVGRIMRVVVQNDARHPDNNGHITTHIGLNLDTQLKDLRELDKEDKKFFKDLIQGKQEEVPSKVTEGKARMKIKEPMVVHSEIVETFLEEYFIDPDDEALMAEMKAVAESLGFDTEDFIEILKKKQKQRLAKVEASPNVPVSPQRQRIESRRRLQEGVKNTARLLLNRLNLDFGGSDIAYKLARGKGVTGVNFAAAVQLINVDINKVLGIGRGERGNLKTEDYKKASDSLEDVLNSLTRRLAREDEDGP